jgi:hypothetical protein
MISVLFAAAMLLADTTAAAQPAQPAQPAKTEAAAPQKAKDDPNTMVCRSEPVLGSRMPVKRCRTKGDMAAQKLEDRQAIERAQIRSDPGH